MPAEATPEAEEESAEEEAEEEDPHCPRLRLDLALRPQCCMSTLLSYATVPFVPATNLSNFGHMPGALRLVLPAMRAWR